MNSVRTNVAHFAIEVLDENGKPPADAFGLTDEPLSTSSYKWIVISGEKYHVPPGAKPLPEKDVELTSLANHVLCLTPEDTHPLIQQLANERNMPTPHRLIEVRTYAAVLALVKEGVGVGLVPKLPAFPSGVKEHTLAECFRSVKLALFYHPERMEDWEKVTDHYAITFRNVLLEKTGSGGGSGAPPSSPGSELP
jgi:DNA-binding transcriptional LysR family regulator